jgi:hypothetical protein
MDNFSISIWLTDAVLLGLAYGLGRLQSHEHHRMQLDKFIAEIKSLRKVVNKLEYEHQQYIKTIQRRLP